MIPRTLVVALAIAAGAVSGSRCAATQQPAPRPRPDTEQARRPSFSLEPAAGSPGTAVAAKGSGFRGDCRIRLSFDTESGPPLGSADADRSGSFSTRLVVPAQATAGRHVVVARGLRPGAKGCVEPSGNSAEASFVLTATAPTLVLDTREARPGKSVHVEGRGFCADSGCSTVTVLIDGQVAAGAVTVSPAGTFGVEAQVPAIKTAGKLVLVAVQTLADQTEIRAFGELQVTPRPNVRHEPVH